MDHRTKLTTEEQVAFMPRAVRRALVDLDFSMLDYHDDGFPYCAKHPVDVSSEADLNDLGRACRAYLFAHPERPSAAEAAYEAEVETWA